MNLNTLILEKLAAQNGLRIKEDADIDSLLQEANLPSPGSHLKGKPPIDLSLYPKPYINADDL